MSDKQNADKHVSLCLKEIACSQIKHRYILPFEHCIILSLCYSVFQSAQYSPLMTKTCDLENYVYLYTCLLHSTCVMRS